MEHQYQTQLLQTRLEVQEQSFKHFSEEIHDNVGQILTLCKLQLRQLESHCKDESLQELITNSTDLIGKALTDLRSISHTMNGNFVNRLGLKEALEKELKYISTGKQIMTELTVAGEIIPIDKEKELLIFRIAQEAITNTLKHAAPSLISVAFIYEPSVFTIKVIDNGAGFEAAAVQANLGFSNMQTRARLLNGNITIDSVKEKGTTITLQIQLPFGNNATYAHSHSR
ncbi:MAG TPA: histidine kinase [Flavipsychrobacter sp.]|nr:histidine kinase [Flavipsychrobacter sp.]